MNHQFYLTLPSNSAASNSDANFTTLLPIQISLDGEWEVGLAEIIYGNKWYNFDSNNNQIVLRDRVSNTDIVIYVP